MDWSERIPAAIEKGKRWRAKQYEGEGTEMMALTTEQAERAIKRGNMNISVPPEVVIALAKQSISGPTPVALAEALWAKRGALLAFNGYDLADDPTLREFVEKMEALDA